MRGRAEILPEGWRTSRVIAVVPTKRLGVGVGEAQCRLWLF